MSNDIQWTNNHLAFRSRKLISLSALLIMSIIGWVTWATLEEVVIGEGKVVPSLSVQTIQSLEGGLVQEIAVRQGQSVVKGQPLAKLEDTRFKSGFFRVGSTGGHLTCSAIKIKG